MIIAVLVIFHFNPIQALTQTNNYNNGSATGLDGKVYTEKFTGLPVGGSVTALSLNASATGNGNHTKINNFGGSPAGIFGDVWAEQFTGLPAGSVINKVSYNILTAAGNVRIKIYSDTSGLPSSLLAESGSIAVGATGQIDIPLTATIPANGIVWTAIENDNTNLRISYTPSGDLKYVAHTFGAGPSPFGTPTDAPNEEIWTQIQYNEISNVRAKIYKDDGVLNVHTNSVSSVVGVGGSGDVILLEKLTGLPVGYSTSSLGLYSTSTNNVRVKIYDDTGILQGVSSPYSCCSSAGSGNFNSASQVFLTKITGLTPGQKIVGLCTVHPNGYCIGGSAYGQARVFSDDGAGGKPYTLLGSTGIIAGSGQSDNLNLGRVPASGNVWAGITFNDTTGFYYTGTDDGKDYVCPVTFGNQGTPNPATGCTIPNEHPSYALYTNDHNSTGYAGTIIGESGNVALNGGGYQQIPIKVTIPASGNVWGAFNIASTPGAVNYGYANTNNAFYSLQTFGTNGPTTFPEWYSANVSQATPYMNIQYGQKGPYTLLGESNSTAVSSTGLTNFTLTATIPSSGNVWGAFETDSPYIGLREQTKSLTGLIYNFTHTYGTGPNPIAGESNNTHPNWMQITYNTGPTVPQPPTNLVATPVSSSQINLSWSAPSNNGGSAITGYKIERYNVTGFISIVNNTGSTTTKYNNTGLIHSTSYTYRVSAINAIGTGAPSNNATAVTLNVASSSPLGLVAVANSTTKINLTWGSPIDIGGTSITGYKIERKIGGGSFSPLVANTGNNSTRYLNSGLTSGLNYTYRLSAINTIGTSTPSNSVSATTFFTSTDPRLDSSGEQRVSYFDGTRNWIFYYDGSANLLYRYSSDNGATVSNSSSTTSGALATNSYFGVYGESNKIVITWSSTSKVLTKNGTISGTSISWSPTTTVLTLSGTNPGQNYYPSFEKFNATHLFLGFNVKTGGNNAAKIYYTKNFGNTWTLSNTLYTTQTNPAILGLAKYSNTKLVAIYAQYSNTEFNYTTFSANFWSANAKTTGASLTANSLKTNAFSIASNGTCGWVGYVQSNSGGALKSMIFCSTTNITFPSTGISSTNLTPSISDIGSEVRLIYQRGNVLYRITTQAGVWGVESVALPNIHNPTFPHAQKIGNSLTYVPVVWREGISSPFTIRIGIDAGFDITPIYTVWEEHNTWVGTQATLIMTDPPLNTGVDWWWARAFVYEAVMINLNGEGAAGAGFAKYIPLGQTNPITAGLAYSYQYAPAIQTYYFGNPTSQSAVYAVKLMPNNCWNLILDTSDPINGFYTECFHNKSGDPVLIYGGLPTYVVWSNTMGNSPGDFKDITGKHTVNGDFVSLASITADPRCIADTGNIYNSRTGTSIYELQFGSTTGGQSSCTLSVERAVGNLPG